MPEPQNRAQRRHPEKIDEHAGRPPDLRQPRQEDTAKHGDRDDQSARAKSSGHKKKTADKWNQ